jgi:hypothetical protein
MIGHMRFRTILWVTIFFVIASCGSSRRTLAIEEGWEFIGESKVNFLRDRDKIEVNSSNKFTDIRFRVEDRDIRLNELKITFENGDKLEPAIDEVITADQYSRDIQIATDGRYIDRIEFRYRTSGNVLKGRAAVLVFGKKYNPYGF